MPKASGLPWERRSVRAMYKLLSRKLLGDGYKSAIRSVLVAVIIWFSLHSLEKTIPIAQKVIIITGMFYTMTVMIQTLTSQDNAKCLKGLFAMPCNEKRTLWEYTAVVGIYALTTKTSLLFALLFAFCKPEPLQIVILILSVLYSILGTIAGYGSFKKMPVVTGALVVGGIAMAMLLPEGMIAAAVLAAADIIAAVVLSLQKLDSYRVSENTKVKAHRTKGKPKMLLWRYVMRYLAAHKNYLLSTVIIIAFSCYLAINFDDQGMKMGCGIGLAMISLNTPMAIIVSSNRGLKRKLEALPDKTPRFFIPYGIVLFIFYMICYALFLTSFGIFGGTVDLKAFITAPLFAAQAAFAAALMEDKFTITKWKTEPDIWHNPRKYITPVVLTLEAALIYMVF